MTEAEKKKVSIIILTYNRKDVLDELLESLLKLNRDRIEIIVVDNCSVDGTHEMVRQKYPWATLIVMPRNIGVDGRNFGIINATGEVLITIDDDIFGIDDAFIALIEQKFYENSNLAAICFQVRDFYNNEICNWCHPYPQEHFSERELPTTEISEGAVAFRKTIFAKTGLYPANFFISHEGADLSARVIDRKLEIIYLPTISVRHKYAQGGRKSWRRYYFDTRNSFLLAIRNYRIGYAVPYLIRRTLVMMIYSIRDGYFKYWIKALLDVLFHFPALYSQRNPISKEAQKQIIHINQNKPGMGYYFKRRFFKKQVRI